MRAELTPPPPPPRKDFPTAWVGPGMAWPPRNGNPAPLNNLNNNLSYISRCPLNLKISQNISRYLKHSIGSGGRTLNKASPMKMICDQAVAPQDVRTMDVRHISPLLANFTTVNIKCCKPESLKSSIETRKLIHAVWEAQAIFTNLHHHHSKRMVSPWVTYCPTCTDLLKNGRSLTSTKIARNWEWIPQFLDQPSFTPNNVDQPSPRRQGNGCPQKNLWLEPVAGVAMDAENWCTQSINIHVVNYLPMHVIWFWSNSKWKVKTISRCLDNPWNTWRT